MSEVARHVVARLVDAGATVATAESLTGGLLGGALTDVPGSSATYLGGVVSYATRLKVSLLGVADEIVENHGVVSSQCAAAMAEGVRDLVDADYAVSTTGVAGPDLQEGKHAGTVHVAVTGPAGTTVLSVHVPGDRTRIREDTVRVALQQLSETVRRDHPREVAGLE